MVSVSRNLITYNAVFPLWLKIILGISFLATLAIFFVLKTQFETELSSLSYDPITNHAPTAAESEKPLAVEILRYIASTPPAALFGIAFCSLSALISLAVLIVSLPVFLFASTSERVARAAGLVKTTLGFFIGSSSAILATISFVSK